MQSSWISTARNNIADLYELNTHSSATDRLASVNALLLDYTFIYRESDRELSPEVGATISSLSSFALKLSNAIPSDELLRFLRVKSHDSSICISSTNGVFNTQDYTTGCSTSSLQLLSSTWLPHSITHFRSGERVAGSVRRALCYRVLSAISVVGHIFLTTKMMAVSSF
jgi:hypothetical protein